MLKVMNAICGGTFPELESNLEISAIFNRCSSSLASKHVPQIAIPVVKMTPPMQKWLQEHPYLEQDEVLPPKLSKQELLQLFFTTRDLHLKKSIADYLC